jgi:hypothetical protein
MKKYTMFLMLGMVLLAADALGQSRGWRGGERGGDRGGRDLRDPRGGDGRSNSGDGTEFGSEYGTIVEGNIFLKDRTPARPARTYEPTSRPTIPLEQVFVIVGIVYEEGDYRAYLEDLRYNTVTRVSHGDSIANGTVEDIGIGGLVYISSSETRWVEIGQDLTGSYPRDMRAPSGTVRGSGSSGDSSGGATEGATTAPAAPVDESTLSMQERMRLRRQQQLNRTGN